MRSEKQVEVEKKLRIIKKGQDDSNLLYWLSLSIQDRMIELEKIRQFVNAKKYGTRQGFQRVYRVTQRA